MTKSFRRALFLISALITWTPAALATEATDSQPASQTAANPHGRYHKGAMSRGFPSYGEYEELFNYPIPLVDRPLTLPEGLTQPEIIGQILGDASRPGSEIYERLSFAAQHGITDRWQLGATFNVRVDPRISLGSAYAIVQYAANPFMNGRLDLGVRRIPCGAAEGNAFSGGFGLPIRYRLTPWLAAISGRPYTYAFGENLLTWDIKECGTTATWGIPLGLLATFAENFNFGLRTGYRRLFGSSASANFIPLAFDFAMMIGRQADVGLTIELPNPLETPSDWDRQQPLVYERKLFIYGQTRF